MPVKNRLKQILDERGIKQVWLAEKVNLHRGTLNNIISNKYNTSLEIAFKISKVLDLKIEDIFEWTDDENIL
jgi:DNA-binding XRE family transcriptional regulator